jgi:hypothetical protein
MFVTMMTIIIKNKVTIVSTAVIDPISIAEVLSKGLRRLGGA